LFTLEEAEGNSCYYRGVGSSPLVIGLAGGSGSGKTTVANAILERVGATHIAYVPHDAYYRDKSALPTLPLAGINWDHPDALETELMIAHIQALQGGQAIDLPEYDFTACARTGHSTRIEPQPIIMVEGILIFADARLRALFDLKIYVDTDADLRFIRRFQRDVRERGRSPESVIAQYLATVRPMHLDFVEPSKRYADVIIPEGGHNRAALEMVVARILALLDGA
jgi:uridine kinase